MGALKPIILEGEVISVHDCVRVIRARHPLSNARDESRWPVGHSIEELLELSGHEGPAAIFLNGEPILWELRGRIRPKANTCLVVRPVVKGGVRTLLMAAVAVLALVVTAGWAAPLLGGLFAGGTVGAGLLGAAITIGGMMLINALFPVQPLEADKEKERYSITGASNQVTPFQPVPVMLGRQRVYPVHIAKPYTEIVGQDQYLRIFVLWGYGPLNITDMKIGETPLSSFEGVQVEHDPGFDGNPNTQLFPNSVLEEQFNLTLEQDEPHERRTAENVNEVSVDITFPNGLYSMNDEGDVKKSKAEISIYYKAAAASSWILARSLQFEDNERSVVRFTHVIVPPTPGQFDVRVVRTDDPRDSGTDKAVWSALRGMRKQRPVAFKKAICATVLRIKASDQLSGVINDLNGIASSYVPVSNSGGSWVTNTVESRNPADLIRRVLQGPMNAQPVPNARINLANLAAFGTYCRQQNFTYSSYINSVRSVWAQCQEIAQAGRGTIVFTNGQWDVTWDDTDDDPAIVQHFTPRNSWGFSASRSYAKTPHAWRIPFANAKKDWQDDERIVYDDGYNASNATIFESIEFPGVDDPDLIWRHGRFHIAQLRLRPETYEVSCDWENLISVRNDRVRLSHDVALIGQQQGRVVSVSGNTVRLDEPVTMEAGKQYVLRVRGTTATDQRYDVTTVATVDSFTITVPGTLSIEAGDLFIFGERNLESIVCRVLAIEPGDNGSARVIMVDDAPEIAQADKGTIPQFDSNISDPFNPAQFSPGDLRVIETVLARGNDFVSQVTVSWTVPRIGDARTYEIQRTNASGNGWVTLGTVAPPATRLEVTGIPAGTYSFRIRSVYGDGTSSAWTTIVNQQLLGLMAPPANVNNFNINVISGQATLFWDPVLAGNLSHYELRWSPEITGVTWGTAQVLFSRITSNSVNVGARPGTYLIRAVTRQGVLSVAPTLIVTELGTLDSMNAVELFEEHPAWAGTHNGTANVSGELRLAPSTNMIDWVSLASVKSLYNNADLVPQGTYQFDNEIDLGAEYTCRLTALIRAYGQSVDNNIIGWSSLAELKAMDDADPSEWDVRLQYRAKSTAIGSGVWGPWTDIRVGDVLARSLQFQLVMMSTSGLRVVPVVVEAGVLIDMEDRIDSASDIVSGTGNYRVDFDPPFLELLGVVPAGQNMATGDYYVVTSKSRTGFNIQFRNAAGTGISRTFDWHAKGYGKAG